jgi:hypothetical protein
MGGGEKDKANRMQDEQYQQQKDEHSQFMKQQQESYDTAKSHANDLYSSIKGGYEGIANKPTTIAPTDYSGMRGGEATNREFMANGGVDDARRNSIEGTIGSMKEFGRTGGLEANDLNRMQGNGYYDEYARTGGVSDADKQNIRARATSPITAAYGRAIDAQDQMSSIQGGYGPGGVAMRDRMLRGANKDASDATLNAEGQIMDRVQQGRQFGIRGISDTAQAANTLRTGNMGRGMEDAGSLDMNLANTVQRGKMWGADALANTEADIAGRQQSYNQNAGEMELGQRLKSLEGLDSLYSGGPGELNANVAQGVQERGMNNADQSELTDSKLRNNPSGWQMAANMIPSIAGGAGGLLTGIGSFGKKKQVYT